LQTAQSPIY
jgi:hypothetical protein